ncbi:hypothetical protein YQE_04146, partial [Dendroctonus ponderosae]
MAEGIFEHSSTKNKMAVRGGPEDEDNVSTLHWPMARIIEVHPGRDNIVRVVTVQTNEGAFKREITKLCLIPMEGD